MTARQSGSLLYVEDDCFTQHEVEIALAEAGFAVFAVASGGEALAALRSDDQPFRGLITDIDLGEGPNGWEVARKARERTADLPVVYVSGASASDWTALGMPHSVMIAKPYATAQIVIAISKLLDLGRTDSFA